MDRDAVEERAVAAVEIFEGDAAVGEARNGAMTAGDGGVEEADIAGGVAAQDEFPLVDRDGLAQAWAGNTDQIGGIFRHAKPRIAHLSEGIGPVAEKLSDW